MSLSINGEPAAGTAGQGTGAQGSASRVYFSTTGKPVATLQMGVLRKKVRASVHQLRRPPAWAIDLQILQDARRDGARIIEILDVESRRRFTAPIEAFDRYGICFNRGFGDQVALPLHYWQVSMVGARQLSLLEG